MENSVLPAGRGSNNPEAHDYATDVALQVSPGDQFSDDVNMAKPPARGNQSPVSWVGYSNRIDDTIDPSWVGGGYETLIKADLPATKWLAAMVVIFVGIFLVLLLPY